MADPRADVERRSNFPEPEPPGEQLEEVAIPPKVTLGVEVRRRMRFLGHLRRHLASLPASRITCLTGAGSARCVASRGRYSPQPGGGVRRPSAKNQYSRSELHRARRANVSMNSPASVTSAPSLRRFAHHSTAALRPATTGMP